MAPDQIEVPSGCTYLDNEKAHEAIINVSTLVCDCDGVLWSGEVPIEGVPEALSKLRALGKRLLFLTNNSNHTRRSYMQKFAAMGLQVAEEEIMSSAYLAAAWLKQHQPDGKAFVLGNPAVYSELSQAGVTYVCAEDVPFCADPRVLTIQELMAYNIDTSYTAVVMGFHPPFNYRHLCYATAVLRECPGCKFILTNADAGDRLKTGRMQAGTGCWAAALQTGSGVQPTIVGKGGDWLAPFVLKQFGLRAEQACMVGDRLDTDIAFGISAGLRTILPLTGVCQAKDVANAPAMAQPDFVVPSFVALALNL